MGTDVRRILLLVLLITTTLGTPDTSADKRITSDGAEADSGPSRSLLTLHEFPPYVPPRCLGSPGQVAAQLRGLLADRSTPLPGRGAPGRQLLGKRSKEAREKERNEAKPPGSPRSDGDWDTVGDLTRARSGPTWPRPHTDVAAAVHYITGAVNNSAGGGSFGYNPGEVRGDAAHRTGQGSGAPGSEPAARWRGYEIDPVSGRVVMSKEEKRVFKAQWKRELKPSRFGGVPEEQRGALLRFLGGLAAWRQAAEPCCLGDRAGLPNHPGCRVCTVPGMAEGAWGRCALVGLADTLLDTDLGSEIDAHDTVIRFGYAPTQGYEVHTGSRTDVRMIRPKGGGAMRCSLAHDVWGQGDDPPRKAYMLLHTEAHMHHLPKSMQSHLDGCHPRSTSQFNGVPVVFLSEPEGAFTRYRDGLLKFLHEHSATESEYPPGWFKGFLATSGYYTAWNLYASDLCSSLDLYGFSDDGWSSHYFAHERTAVDGAVGPVRRKPNARQPMKPTHVMGAENYAFQLLMSNAMLCLRDANTCNCKIQHQDNRAQKHLRGLDLVHQQFQNFSKTREEPNY